MVWVSNIILLAWGGYCLWLDAAEVKVVKVFMSDTVQVDKDGESSLPDLLAELCGGLTERGPLGVLRGRDKWGLIIRRSR